MLAFVVAYVGRINNHHEYTRFSVDGIHGNTMLSVQKTHCDHVSKEISWFNRPHIEVCVYSLKSDTGFYFWS